MEKNNTNQFSISLTSQQLAYINHYLPKGFILGTGKDEPMKDKSKTRVEEELKRINTSFQSKDSQEGLSFQENRQSGSIIDQFLLNQGQRNRTEASPFLTKKEKYSSQKADFSKQNKKKSCTKKKNAATNQFTTQIQQFTKKKNKAQQYSQTNRKKWIQFLNNLFQIPSAWPFRHPVDAIAMQVPEYYDIVENPMDLGTLIKKFKKHKYFNFSDIIEHVQLIISNSLLFNAGNEQYIHYTKTFETHFKNLLQQFNSETGNDYNYQISIATGQLKVTDSQTGKEEIDQHKRQRENKEQKMSASGKSIASSQKYQNISDMYQQPESYCSFSQFTQNEFNDPKFKVGHIHGLRKMLETQFSPQYRKEIYKNVFPEKDMKEYRGFLKLTKNQYARVNNYLKQVQRNSQKNIRRYLQLKKQEIYESQKQSSLNHQNKQQF